MTPTSSVAAASGGSGAASQIDTFLRFDWMSAATGGNVTQGPEIIIGHSIDLYDSVGSNLYYTKATYYVTLKSNDWSKFKEIVIGICDASGNRDSNLLSLAGLTNGVYQTFRAIAGPNPFSGITNSLVSLTLAIRGTEVVANVGATDISVASLSVEMAV